MSTAKSLCYMAPPALVFKMSATKNGGQCRSVPPSSPLCRTRYLTDSAHIIVTAIVNFLASCSNLKFYECTLTSVRTAFITNLQSTIFKDHIDIFAQPLSWVGAWTLDYCISISIFLESFGISKFMYSHRLMFKSGFVAALQLTIFCVSCS